MNTINQEAPERQEIEALLPWHAAGTLSRSDAERVERALSRDHELAQRFELVVTGRYDLLALFAAVAEKCRIVAN